MLKIVSNFPKGKKAKIILFKIENEVIATTTTTTTTKTSQIKKVQTVQPQI